jgi:exopolysaccharide biosynthesis polyprenyl glycosylphosphotransferase
MRDAVVDGIRVLGNLDEAGTIVQRKRVSEIVLALPHEAYNRMLAVITTLETLPVQVSLVPDVLDLAWFMTRVDDLNGVPLLRLRESPLNGPARALKRLIDIVASSLLLILCAPLIAALAIWVKLDSPGPAFIWQERIGENAQPFKMVKLRSMYARGAKGAPNGSEAEQGEMSNTDQTPSGPHKRRDDPRVTRAGRYLRRFSIDELPQLVNVLRGEMSLVGPRPELPWLVDCYTPWQRHRFAVPPGMTGWWQINGRSDRPMHLNVEDDLYYIHNYSLWLDVIILLRTLPVVLGGKGAY